MRSERRFACCCPVRDTTPGTGKKSRHPGSVAASPRSGCVGVDVLDVPCATTPRHAAYSGDDVQGPTGEPRWPAWRCHRCRAPHRPPRLRQGGQEAGFVGERHVEVCGLPPARLRTTSTGTCSSERPRLAALPPRCRAGRDFVSRRRRGRRRRIAASWHPDDEVGVLSITSYRQPRIARSAAACGPRSCCSWCPGSTRRRSNCRRTWASAC